MWDKRALLRVGADFPFVGVIEEEPRVSGHVQPRQRSRLRVTQSGTGMKPMQRGVCQEGGSEWHVNHMWHRCSGVEGQPSVEGTCIKKDISRQDGN